MDNAQGTFNQAGYSQERLHELFQRIDLFSVNLFVKNESGLWNYETVFNDLNTAASAISAKLTPDEEKELANTKYLVRYCFRTYPAFRKGNAMAFNPSSTRPLPIEENQDKITDILIEYRKQIERAMDAHGIGNPNKLNPTKSAIT